VAEIIDNVSNLDFPHSIAEVKFEDGLLVHEKFERGFHPTADLYDLFDDIIQK